MCDRSATTLAGVREVWRRACSVDAGSAVLSGGRSTTGSAQPVVGFGAGEGGSAAGSWRCGCVGGWEGLDGEEPEPGEE